MWRVPSDRGGKRLCGASADAVRPYRSGFTDLARPQVNELVDRFLELHEVDPATTRKLRSQLKHARDAFGDREPDELRKIDVEAAYALGGRPP